MYVDLDRISDPQGIQALPRLAQARAIIFDLRGYPNLISPEFLRFLTRTPIRSAQFLVPFFPKPGQAEASFTDAPLTLEPAEPHLSARKVFLTDGRAVSYAESVLGIVEHYKLGEIVGAHTAGTNGNMATVTLPGGFRVSLTGLKDLKHDGSQHHGVGIHPTVPARPTRAGIAAGRDEVLEKGIEVAKWPLVGAAPAITAAGVVNAASFAGGSVAPGEMVTIFGTGLGPYSLVLASYDKSGYLPSSLADTRVFFDGVQAPLVHAVASQVTALVPYSVKDSTRVRVEYQGRSSNEAVLAVTPTLPGIFSTLVNQDGSINAAQRPARRGDIVTLFATGEGRLTPSAMDGRLPVPGKWPVPESPCTVTFGDVPGEIVFRGEVYAGVLQLNVKIPATASAGDSVPVVLQAGATPSADTARLVIR